LQGVAQVLFSHEGFQGLWLAIQRGLRKGNQRQTCHKDESKNLFHTSNLINGYLFVIYNNG
jgi:hypothetical protein